MIATDSYHTALGRAQRLATVLGILGIVLVVLLAPASGGVDAFFESYLVGFIFWIGLTLGCLSMLLIQHLAGGPWGAIARRFLEAGASNIFMMAILFIPVLIGMQSLYPWTNPEYVAAHPTVDLKSIYLNIPAFIFRSAIYFATWCILVTLFRRWSQRQDAGEDLAQHMRNAGALGIILFIVTMTFAAFDWGMSLTPEWFSGMYGVIFMIGQAISAVSLLILMLVNFRDVDPLPRVLNDKRLQDFGNFLMAFTMFWAYVQASQLIIVWSNNIVETNTWYVARLESGWGWVSAFLLVFHFFVPFLILFSRWVKQKGRALVWVAAWMILMRMVDIYWIIVPAFEREGFPFRLLDVAVLLALGGIWLSFFFRRLKATSILPTHDPRIEPELTGAAAHD
jgi:hypothetical protein